MISENRIAGNILSEGEIKYRQMIERVSDAFVSLDKDWIYTYVNKKAAEIFGRRAEELVGKHIWTEFPEGIDQPFYKAYYRAMETQNPEHIMEYYEPYDKWFENTIYPSPEGISIYFKDITERKRIEQALKESEEKFRTLTSNAPVAIFQTDLNGECIYVNDEWLKYSGFKFEEAMGSGWVNAIHPDDKERVFSEWTAAVSSGNRFKSELRFLSKTGKTTWLDAKALALSDSKNQKYGYIGMASDISERKKLDSIISGEHAVMELIATGEPLDKILHTIAQNYEAFDTSALCSILLVEKDGRHFTIGSAKSFPPEYNNELLKLPIGPAEGSCGTATYLKKRVITASIATDPKWAKYKDFTLSFNLRACWSSPIISEDNIVLGTFAIYYREERSPTDEDIHYIDRAANLVKIALVKHFTEIKIKESEEKYRILIEQASDAIFIADGSGKLLTVNKSACRLAECTEEELLQMNIYDFAIPEDLEKNPFHFDELRQGKTVVTERMMKTKNDQKLYVEVIAKFLSDGRLMAFIRDITDRKQAEQRLIESEERLSRAEKMGNLGHGYFDIENNSMQLSAGLHKIFGTTPETFSHTTEGLESVIHPDDYQLQLKAVDTLFKTGEVEVEFRILRPDGDIRNVLFKTLLSKKPNGELSSSFTTALDITDRKHAETELIRIRNEKETALNRINDKVISVDADWRYTFLNDAAIEEHPLGKEATLGKILWDVHPEMKGTIFWEKYHEAMSTKKAIELENYYGPYDTWFYVKVYPSEDGLTIFYQDIKERKKAEVERQSLLLRNEQTIATMLDGFILADDRGRIIEVNPAYCKMTGYRKEELLNKNINELEAALSPGAIEKRIAEMLEKKSIQFETRHRRKDGILIDLEVSISIMSFDEQPLVAAFVRDITERKKALQQIENYTLQLQQLTAHLQSIREEERRRIGREIHDDLGQQLTAIKMDVAWIDKKIPDESSLLKKKLENIIQLLDGTNRSVRRILSELKPSILDEYGLLDALEWQGKQFTANTGIPVEISANQKEIQLSEDIATCIFRVFQESLTNITRHAHAKKVLASLFVSKDSISVCIEDDGNGFENPAIYGNRSFGILGMQERVRSLGGNFEIKSVVGKGTTISITIPVKNNDKE